ncbi:MAG TPA: type II secretion system protein GspM [Rhizomicrobium sp.]|jgi:general secretion pathway protein M
MTSEKLRNRMLALSILSGILAIAGFIILAPILDAFAAQRHEIALSAQTLEAYQSEVAARPQIEAQYAAMSTTEASLGAIVQGRSTALAAANMQGLIKSLVERESGQVRSAQNLTPSSSNGFEKVAIQYDLSLPLNRLKDTAYKLETGAPYLFLDDVDIRMAESWQSEGAPNDPPPLQVRWTVRGYRWAGSP